MEERRHDYPDLMQAIGKIEGQTHWIVDNLKTLNSTVFGNGQAGLTTILKGVYDRQQLVINEVGKINDRCLNRTEGFLLMQKHMKDTEKIKEMYSDRSFQLFLKICGGSILALIGYLIGILLK